jgi:urate oxidase
MAHAFLDGSNTDMTATDTQKNTVRGQPHSYPTYIDLSVSACAS